VWLERKVKEWGCMQALIDFDGWRKWKDFADKSEDNDSTSKLSVSYSSVAPNKKSTNGLSPTIAANTPDTNAETERKSKRKSLSVVPPPEITEESETPPPETESS
jgi:osomolarity two-component system response regulator SSK1